MSASAVLRLQKVGFSAEQVEALADFMDTQAASKADLEAAEHRLDTRLLESKAELEAVEHRLNARLLENRAELKGCIADVRSDLLKTILAVMVVNAAVVVGAMVGLVKLLGH